ncbi:MAG TPA: acetate kinase [Thermoproteota archaeon]|nr:acetate kinase [Thermoproteota archaeon]
MKILVINCGSSSIKYQLLDMEREEVLAEGLVEKIGEQGSLLSHRTGKEVIREEVTARNHREGLRLVIDHLLKNSGGVIKDLSEISAVGHRVVHGGDAFIESTLIDEKVIRTIRKYAVLAPLHNPPNLAGIEAAMDLLPEAPQVAVFDTSFHQTMPKEAYVYALPYEFYEKYGIRRYGFHGTSHRYVALRAAQILRRNLENLRMITCHLGNGCSITAVDRGKSVDTSMGFTPLEGLPMGTRCGDIDPSIIFFVAEKARLDLAEVNEILNRKSGLLGISGVSNDVREIKSEAQKGNDRAELALKILTYKVRKYIGAYAAVLGGVDAVVFTAGIGENEGLIRSEICRGLEFLGVRVDESRNADPEKWQGVISSEDSKIKVLVVPTREELMIARDTAEILRRRGSD